jgi:hypothetical protein
MPKTKLKALIMVLAQFDFSAYAQAATFEVATNVVNRADYQMRGPIEPGDGDRLRSLFKQFQLDYQKAGQDSYGPLEFGLVVDNISGGNVSEAIKIGRLLREKQSAVTVSGKCLSACVLILSGAVKRNYTRSALPGDFIYRFSRSPTVVGIHRPYFATAVEPSKISASYKSMQEDIRSYFRDMNTPESLADQMFSIVPERMKVLNYEQILYYWPEEDPVYNEQEVAKTAKYYGTEPGTFRQRVVEAKSECQKFETGPKREKYEYCVDAVKWGLSLGEYMRRYKIAEMCENLKSVSDCARNVMKSGIAPR